MKLLNLITVVAAAVSTVYGGAYCPHNDGECDANKTPAEEKSTNFDLQYVQGNYTCSGTIKIVNDCEFELTDFEFDPQEAKGIKWYGSQRLNTNKDGDGIVLADADEEVLGAKEKINKKIPVTKDKNCWASLVDEVKAISLMDDKGLVICHAIFKGGEPTKEEAEEMKKSADEAKAGTKTSTTAPSPTSTKKDDKNGALSNYVVPSLALYAVGLLLSLYL